MIDTIRDIYERGRREGVFRAGIDEIDLHMSISALSFFNIANRPTFSTIFKRDMSSPKALATRRAQVVETLAFALPGMSVVVGAGVLGLGAVAYGVRRWWSASRASAGPHR